MDEQNRTNERRRQSGHVRNGPSQAQLDAAIEGLRYDHGSALGIRGRVDEHAIGAAAKTRIGRKRNGSDVSG